MKEIPFKYQHVYEFPRTHWMALSYPREQEVWGFDINFKNVGILLNVTDL